MLYFDSSTIFVKKYMFMTYPTLIGNCISFTNYLASPKSATDDLFTTLCLQLCVDKFISLFNYFFAVDYIMKDNFNFLQKNVFN